MTKVLKPAVVLLISDDSLVRALAIEVLSDVGGLRVLTASDADKAFGILQVRLDVCLLISDVSIPGTMDGVALAHVLYAQRPDVSVILTSATGMPATVPGNASILLKPYGADELFGLIRLMLGVAAEPVVVTHDEIALVANPDLAQQQHPPQARHATEADVVRAHIRAVVQRLLGRRATPGEPGFSPPQDHP